MLRTDDLISLKPELVVKRSAAEESAGLEVGGQRAEQQVEVEKAAEAAQEVKDSAPPPPVKTAQDETREVKKVEEEEEEEEEEEKTAVQDVGEDKEASQPRPPVEQLPPPPAPAPAPPSCAVAVRDLRTERELLRSARWNSSNGRRLFHEGNRRFLSSMVTCHVLGAGDARLGQTRVLVGFLQCRMQG